MRLTIIHSDERGVAYVNNKIFWQGPCIDTTVIKQIVDKHGAIHQMGDYVLNNAGEYWFELQKEKFPSTLSAIPSEYLEE